MNTTHKSSLISEEIKAKIKRNPTQQPYLDKLEFIHIFDEKRTTSPNFAKSFGKKYFNGKRQPEQIGYHERELDQILEDERNKYELQKITAKYEQILEEESRWD